MRYQSREGKAANLIHSPLDAGCGRCAYYVSVLTKSGKEDGGTCHRYPPTATLRGTMWPRVCGANICGEYFAEATPKQ